MGSVISETHDLTSLNGLQNVQYVGADFVVEGNDRLRSARLPKLRFVERNFHVFDNTRLTRLDMRSLESVGAQFIIATSPLRQVVFPSLTYTGDDFIIEHMRQLRRASFPMWKRHSGFVLIEVNNQLRRFSAPKLKSIESTLTFRLNDRLTAINMESLDFIGSRLSFIGNVSLSNCVIQGLVDQVGIYDIGARPYASNNGGGQCQLDFSATSQCRIIEGDVVIHNAQDVQRYRQMAGNGCVSIRGSLYIRNTAGLGNLNAFRGLRFVSDWVSIARNTGLRSLDGLRNLRFVGYGLVAERNQGLRRINLAKLEAVGTYVHIFHNPQLRTIGLAKLQVIGDMLVIEANDALKTANLSKLEWLGALMDIENNDMLRQVRLDRIKHSIGSVRIRYNQSLLALRMPMLVHIGQSLRVIHNVSLRCIVMPRLEFVRNDVQIDYNPLLGNCTVYALIGQIDHYDIGGLVRVFSNGQEDQCPNYQQGQAGPIGQTPNFDDYDMEH